MALEPPVEVAAAVVREEPLAPVDYQQAQDYQKWRRSRTG